MYKRFHSVVVVLGVNFTKTLRRVSNAGINHPNTLFVKGMMLIRDRLCGSRVEIQRGEEFRGGKIVNDFPSSPSILLRKRGKLSSYHSIPRTVLNEQVRNDLVNICCNVYCIMRDKYTQHFYKSLIILQVEEKVDK